MGTRHLISLPIKLIEKCEEQGEAIVAAFRSGNQPRSLLLSSHNAENDPVLQARSKAGECAFAIWAGLDPLKAVWWEVRPDDDYDVVFRGLRVDVKTVEHPNKRHLCWPATKTDLYLKKNFDALVHVKEWTASDFEVCRCISKQRFFDKHLVADASHKFFDEGTWYMHEDELAGMSKLLEVAAASSRSR